MDSCSSSTNLNHSTSIIYVSPVLKSIDHVSGSHITVFNCGTLPYVSLVLDVPKRRTRPMCKTQPRFHARAGKEANKLLQLLNPILQSCYFIAIV